MVNPEYAVRRVLVSAILVIISGAAIDTMRAATWSAINTGLSSVDVSVNSIVIAPSSTLYANTRTPLGATGIFKTTDGAGTWKALSSIVGAGSLVVDPKTPSTIYTLAARGLLKSTNGGDSWSIAGTGLPTNGFVSTLAIDPVTTSTLYAVVGGPASAVFKSTDSGGTWNQLDTGPLPNNTFSSSFVIDPVTPSRLYLAASVPQNSGPPGTVILRSTDGGDTWTTLDPGLPFATAIRSLVISPAAPSVIYAVAATTNGPPVVSILKSADGGESWTALDPGLPSGASLTSVAIDSKNSSVIYLAVVFGFAQAGGILKSTDGGETWRAIDPGLPPNTPIQSLAIDPVTSTTMYLLGNGVVFKSMDGGAKWNRATAGLNTIDVQTLATNPLDPASVYAGAGNGVFKTGDGGANWTRLFAFQLFLPSPPPAVGSPFPDGAPAYPRSLLIDSGDPDILYATTTRGNGCYYADNLLFKSTDGGATWSDSVSPDKSGCVMGGFFGPAGLEAMDPTDPNTLYVAETDDEDGGFWLLRSNDGGATWNSIGNFPQSVQAGLWTLVIDPSNPATLYAGLEDVPAYDNIDPAVKPGVGGVFKSTDGGMTWTGSGLAGAAVNLLAIDPNQPNVLYAGTQGNYSKPGGFRGMYKSADGGATWSPLTNGLSAVLVLGSTMTAIVIDPANSNILYVGFSGAGVFKSSDGGANWSPFTDGLANLDVRALAAAPGGRHILYAGTAGGVFKILDTAP
jgi:photosystem II stability/assembly factor-like uncharacterized protein